MEASADVRAALLVVLDEAVEGASGPATYFVDNEPGHGLRGTLADLTAIQASATPEGRSIASIVAHMAFAMESSAAWIEGVGTAADWDASWEPSSVDAGEWIALRERLEVAYRGLRAALAASDLAGEAAPEAIGAIAHVAYHLGAVRAKARRLIA